MKATCRATLCYRVEGGWAAEPLVRDDADGFAGLRENCLGRPQSPLGRGVAVLSEWCESSFPQPAELACRLLPVARASRRCMVPQCIIDCDC